MDGRQPANVTAGHNRVLAFDPAQCVRVLLIAVVNRLVARALRVHVNDRVYEAGCPKPGRQSNRTEGGVRARQFQLRGGIARTDHCEILPAANPAGPKAIDKVVADLPFEA